MEKQNESEEVKALKKERDEILNFVGGVEGLKKAPAIIQKQFRTLDRKIFLAGFDETEREFATEFVKIKMLSKLPKAHYKVEIDNTGEKMKVKFRPVYENSAE